MLPDKWHLYRLMYYSRLFEITVMRFWNDGKIYGEMHLGTGEEAIMAGIVSQLRDGDALSLDHRGTSPLLMRGCDPIQLMKELFVESKKLLALENDVNKEIKIIIEKSLDV